MTIRFQNFEEVPLFSSGELFLEVTETVIEDIDWRCVSRRLMESLPKTLPVELQYRIHSLSVGMRYDPSQFPQLGLAVSHQEQLMGSMKAHKIMHGC